MTRTTPRRSAHIRHIRKTFEESARDEVLDCLRAIVDPFGHDVSERVRAAVVLASNGEFDKFLEMEHEDWETELTRRLGVD